MDYQMNVRFLAGLQRLREKGFQILFNGEECPTENWDQMLHRKDGGFFKREYVDECSSSINFQWISLT